jgi:phospholipid/cholesterol/gamma-HCH transport system ATP-binding protein
MVGQQAMHKDSVDRFAPAMVVCVEDLDLGYGDRIVLEAVNFCIAAGEIVTILGGSGCGKSTLLKGLIGLLRPMKGSVTLAGKEIYGENSEEALSWIRRRIGVLFQSGALIGSLTLAENTSLPIEEFTDLPKELIDEIVELKLEQVGLAGFGHYMPAELSGGMRKRAGLARALALDPKLLFCDEPAAGLDPVTAADMDQLLVELNSSLGITMIVITHELASIHAISQRSIMLDRDAKGVIAIGSPGQLKSESTDPRVQAFFHRQAQHKPTARA